jgi:rhamnosyltransferase
MNARHAGRTARFDFGEACVFCVAAQVSAQTRDEEQADPPSTSPRVAAVVVAYHPDATAEALVAALRLQVARVIVVDNASTPASRARFARWTGDAAFELIANVENLGIAAALNQAAERARAAGAGWLATFDQDSAVPDGLVAGLLGGLARCAEPERVAVLAPLYRDLNLGFTYSAAGPLGREADADVSVAATSGNLVSLRAWAEVGGFDEGLFIDLVDFDFCLRCRRRGWRVREVRSVVLGHRQGRWEPRPWRGRTARFNDYGAVRRYYQVRNRLVLAGRHAAFDPRWVARDVWGHGCDLVKLALFGADRRRKFAAVFTGAWDALRGRRGRWTPPE